MTPILFTMTVDTEEEWDWDAGWPTRDLSVRNIRELPRLQEVCERHGVATTYFTNRAVLDDEAARSVVLGLSKRGHVEIGMHIHPWNTPPLGDDGPVHAANTFIHNLPRELILAKLNSVYEQFTKHGLRPTSFRGGRYSSGPTVQEFLRNKGFLADASVVPYSTWLDEKAPDYLDRDLRPARLAPRHPGEPALWEIPLTLGFTRRGFGMWRRFYNGVESSWLSKLRLIGIVERLGIVRKTWLNFEMVEQRDLFALLRTLRKLAPPCICFTVHSSSLLAGGNPYTPTQAAADALFARVNEVFAALRQWQEFQPATVTEVAKKLEEQHACSWNQSAR